MKHQLVRTTLRISLVLALISPNLALHAQENEINWPSVNTNAEEDNSPSARPNTTAGNLDNAVQENEAQTRYDSYGQTMQTDSVPIENATNLDSIAKREEFIQDSIAKREAFIQDSLIKRKRILDSLTLFRNQFQTLLEASLKTESEDIITTIAPIQIIGDSILSNFTYNKLVFNLTTPYTPWKASVNLSTQPVKFGLEKDQKQISYIKIDKFVHKYVPFPQKKLLIIHSSPRVYNKPYGKLYSEPVDSVFYNSQNRIIKIKRYNKFHQVSGNYKKGAFLYMHVSEVKQFSYNSSDLPSKIEVIKFCDRWRKYDPEKVCGVTTYTLNKEGDNFIVTRQNDPANVFADGTFNFEYDNSGTLKSVAFQNLKKNEDWKTIVELNEDGNVSRYVYINKDKVNRTLLVQYNEDPNAKNKVETISCYFEDDRISYRQVNNTTGKIRIRDRLTMEWSPWE